LWGVLSHALTVLFIRRVQFADLQSAGTVWPKKDSL
jgi:hypothetical protein